MIRHLLALCAPLPSYRPCLSAFSSVNQGRPRGTGRRAWGAGAQPPRRAALQRLSAEAESRLEDDPVANFDPEQYTPEKLEAWRSVPRTEEEKREFWGLEPPVCGGWGWGSGAVLRLQDVRHFFFLAFRTTSGVALITVKPLSGTLQPPSVTLQPPSVTLKPPAITHQPPSVTLQPLLGASNRRRLSANCRRFPSHRHRLPPHRRRLPSPRRRLPPPPHRRQFPSNRRRLAAVPTFLSPQPPLRSIPAPPRAQTGCAHSPHRCPECRGASGTRGPKRPPSEAAPVGHQPPRARRVHPPQIPGRPCLWVPAKSGCLPLSFSPPPPPPQGLCLKGGGGHPPPLPTLFPKARPRPQYHPQPLFQPPVTAPQPILQCAPTAL